jgi:hypothetical protein
MRKARDEGTLNKGDCVELVRSRHSLEEPIIRRDLRKSALICRGSGTRKKARKKSRAFVISVEGGLNSPYRPCHRQA